LALGCSIVGALPFTFSLTADLWARSKATLGSGQFF
jgi:hypothetical protein